jgi:hypothetical protein
MSPTTTSIRERSTLAKHAAITDKQKHGLSPAHSPHGRSVRGKRLPIWPEVAKIRRSVGIAPGLAQGSNKGGQRRPRQGPGGEG